VVQSYVKLSHVVHTGISDLDNFPLNSAFKSPASNMLQLVKLVAAITAEVTKNQVRNIENINFPNFSKKLYFFI
jgi:hypothetical protein